MKNLALSLCAMTAITISGCASFADMAGADSATLNAQSAQSFSKMTQEARAKNQLDMSSNTYQRINSVFLRLKPYADQMNQTGQRFEWQLAVLKSDTVNAYVAPGGKVVFYTGIVNKLNLTNDEIAAIMGHEMTHALEEHAKSKIGAQSLTNIVIDVGKSYAEAHGANIGDLGNAAIALGSQIGIGLPYSRNLESRADYGGLMLMARAGYNPNAAISLWEKMDRLDGAGGSSFLSTHPSNSQRIGDMRKNLPAAMAVYKRR